MTGNFLGERIATLRDSVGFDQRTAAKAAGLSAAMWQRIEAGTKTPKMWHLLSIASALGCALTAITEEGSLRDRALIATRSVGEAALPPLEQQEQDRKRLQTRLMGLLELDASLRDEGIGRHA